MNIYVCISILFIYINICYKEYYIYTYIDRQPSDIGLDELDTNVRAYGYFVGYLGCSKMQVCREPPGGGRDGNPHKGRKYGSDIDDRGTT